MNDGPVMQAERPAAQKIRMIDCDIHPMMRSPADVLPYLSPRWREHYQTIGSRYRQPFLGSSAYPKATPQLSRRDSWPPAGGPPGSDLDFMRAQHLDPLDIELGMLQPLFPRGMDERNLDFAAAMCRAVNDWQVEEWTSREPRLKANITVACDDPAAAVEEIERCARSGHHVQVSFATRAIEPLGSRKYWPIYEAAERHNLPLGLHSVGNNGNAVQAGGAPSYYFEEHQCVSLSLHAMVASMVIEGVFEAFPQLKLIVIEGGFAWAASLGWRLDAHWQRFRAEVPHLKRPPSEYLRRNVWYTTQPMDEPETPGDLRDMIGWVGWDRILFATDYPHWDSDDPRFSLKLPMSQAERAQLLGGNARALFGIA
jgi:predicted TIM-barrel fold metal-dependent hydrolase